jgi:hypothetical protein
MPTDITPVFSHGNGDLVVHPQYSNCGAPGFSESINFSSISTPNEMITPFITAWVEKGNAVTAERINAFNSRPFVLIAHLTSQTQIFFVVGSTQRDRLDMINLKHCKNEILMA